MYKNITLSLSRSELIDIESFIEYALPEIHKMLGQANEDWEIAHFASMYSAAYRLCEELNNHTRNQPVESID